MSKFSIFLIGYLIFVCGVAFALDSFGLSSRWVLISVLVLIGLGVAAGASNKRDDPPAV